MRWIISVLILLISCTFLPTRADENSIQAQRAQFIEAQSALHRQDRAQFTALTNQLKTYVLYPYLIYEDLIQRLPQASATEITDFLHQYADTPLAERLRNTWLAQLARQEQWPLFLKYYQPTDNLELQCTQVAALLNTQQQAAAFRLLPDLWLTGSVLPPACETAFGQWRQAGKLSDDLIWQRAQLAIANGDSKLVKKLDAWAPPALQQQIKIALIAQNKPQEASQLFSSWVKDYQLTEAQQQEIIRTIAIGLARSNDPNSMNWLAAVKPAYANQRLAEWRIRTALRHLDWQQVAHWISQLPPQDRQQPNWRYWYARALGAMGDTAAAAEIYRNLRTQVDYYGLLASQQLKQPYKPLNLSPKFDQQILGQIENIPAVIRARELYNLQMVLDARREWQWALADMNKQQLRMAAELAFQWQWYDRAIVCAAKAGDYSNVSVRFPSPYNSAVRAAAKRAGVNPAWVYAIMRQESSFMPDAKSGVGAIGLMQLMPHTACLLAKMKLNEYDILDSSTNIGLGSRYLKQLSDGYNGNLMIATAAYNVGPTRLHKWLPLYKTLPSDVWGEILPWQETRNYIKAVLLGTAIYQQQL